MLNLSIRWDRQVSHLQGVLRVPQRHPMIDRLLLSQERPTSCLLFPPLSLVPHDAGQELTVDTVSFFIVETETSTSERLLIPVSVDGT